MKNSEVQITEEESMAKNKIQKVKATFEDPGTGKRVIVELTKVGDKTKHSSFRFEPGTFKDHKGDLHAIMAIKFFNRNL